MANEGNLVPLNKRAKSEQREIRKKAGKASGVARRRRKALREDLKAMLLTKIMTEDGTEKTTQEEIVLALINAALRGDVRAFLAIRDTIGEKPAEKVEASVRSSPPRPISPERLREIKRELDAL